LSRYGLRVIREMNRVGTMVDVSHTGIRSSLEAIDASAKPVIMSHSNVRNLADHPRNICDEQIKAIAAKNGVIGIAGISAMTSSNDAPDAVSPQEIFRHIDYIAQLVGPAHVGFGLDYIPNTQGLIAWIKSRPETFPADQHRKQMLSAGPQVIEPTVNLMLQSGYSEADARNISGGNWLRVFRTCAT
jgi:membrane dipeptidase